MDPKTEISVRALTMYSVYVTFAATALYRENKWLRTKLDEKHEEMKYMVHVLNRNNVELDALDYLALPSVRQKIRDENTD